MLVDFVLVKFFTKKRIPYNEISKIRGYIGNKFIEHPEFHNHLEKNFNYSYPSIQYKSIEGQFHILAFGSAIQLIYQILPEMQEFIIDESIVKIDEISIKKEKIDIAVTNDFHVYKFISPYFAFNQENYRKFKELESLKEKNQMINKILIGNILSALKGFGIWVDEKIYADFYMDKIKTIHFKGVNVIGIEGEFATNINFPDYIGLGKGISRGNGVIIKSDKR